MSKNIFITGTNTDVGKTFVTALIVKKLRDAGFSAGYFKFAASGEEIENIPGDAFFVKKFANLDFDMKNFVPYSFKNSYSPHLAAKIENKKIIFSVIEEKFLSAKKNFDFLVVEGCGGIVCPLRFDEKILMLDEVVKKFDLPAVIVIDSKLGEINSAVLTAEHLFAKKISVKGLIFNRFDEKNILHTDNKKVIEKIINLPTLATVKKNSSKLDISVEQLIKIF